MGKYTIILQAAGSREFTILRSVENLSPSPLYLEFDYEGLPDGEYTYAAFPDESGEGEITPRTPILDSVLTVDDEEVRIRDIQPLTGLLIAGNVETANIYENNNDNEIFYYEQ